jgi:hypothetical protein
MATMTILVSGWSDSLATQAQPIEPLVCTSSLLNFWFPDDNLLTKSRIEAKCGMSVYHMNIYVKFDNNTLSTIFTRVMPLFVL